MNTVDEKRLKALEEKASTLLNTFQTLMNKEAKQEVSELEFIQNRLYIRTKDKRLIRLQLNEPQRKLYAAIQKQRDEGKPVRIIVLKARQEGISTAVEAVIFHQTAKTANVNSLIVAHDLDSTDYLFRMSRLYHEMLPDNEKPLTVRSNRKEINFDAPLRSNIFVDTARNVNVGTSYTIHNFHASEVAKWGDNASELMLSVNQAIPDHPGTMVVLESTAKGVGGYFYDQYWRAKRGESDYIAVFIAWFELSEYSRSLEKDSIKEKDFILTDTEKRLKETYNLSLEQLNWRRWAIKNNCDGSEENFAQEYPSNDVEAFLVSGRPVFDVKVLKEWYDLAPEPKLGDLHYNKSGEVQFYETRDGYLKIWKKPEHGKRYAIGVDVAEGLVHGDYSCIEVLEYEKLTQVAEWHGHIDPDLLGDETEKLATYYNNALVGVEINNHGLTTLNKLKNCDVMLYSRTVYDKILDEERKELGWQTNLKTKPLMIDDLGALIREKEIDINSKELISEAMTYVKDDKGATNAQSGCFDDRIVSLAIAIQTRKQIPEILDVIVWDDARLYQMSQYSQLKHINPRLFPPGAIMPEIVEEEEYW